MFHETSVGPRWMAYLGAAVLVFLAAITAVAIPAIVAKPDAPNPWIVWLLPVAFLLILAAGVLFLIRRITLTVSDTTSPRTSCHSASCTSPSPKYVRSRPRRPPSVTPAGSGGDWQARPSSFCGPPAQPCA